MALLFTPILIMGVVLLIKNPESLRKRMEMKEREKEQRGVVTLSGLLLVGSSLWQGSTSGSVRATYCGKLFRRIYVKIVKIRHTINPIFADNNYYRICCEGAKSLVQPNFIRFFYPFCPFTREICRGGACEN